MHFFATSGSWLSAQIKKPSHIAATLAEVVWRDWGGWRAEATWGISRECPLDNHLNLGTSAPERHSLGELDKLPNELMTLVLLSVDIPSLMVFRRVNRRAMQAVDSIPEYSKILKGYPIAIRTILSMEANSFDLKQLYSTLTGEKCSSCPGKDIMAYIYLFDCRKFCFDCMCKSSELLVPCICDYVDTTDDSGETLQRNQQLPETQYPSILSLPFFFSSADDIPEGLEGLRGLRVRLFDRQTVGEKGSVPCWIDATYFMDMTLRHMAFMVTPWAFKPSI